MAVVAVLVDAERAAVVADRAVAQQPVPAHLQRRPADPRRREQLRAAVVVAERAAAMPIPIPFPSFEALPLSHGFHSSHGLRRSTITIKPMR